MVTKWALFLSYVSSSNDLSSFSSFSIADAAAAVWFLRQLVLNRSPLEKHALRTVAP